MGTNFFRVLKQEDIIKRKAVLIQSITEMDVTNISNVDVEFRIIEDTTDSWTNKTPWDVFIDGIKVHLGKRSGGWKFCWNFHDKKFYTNKEELLAFIRSGIIVDEYGVELDTEEFITMALNWGEPNGLDNQTYYAQNPRLYYNSSYDDSYIDGLRVSSSTEFF
jgi:hypothetical protein